MTLEDLSNLLTVIAGIGALVFVVAYLLRSRWWVNMAGRNMMAFMFVALVLIGITVYVRFTGERLHDWVRVAAWALLSAVIWWRVVILLRVQSVPAIPVDERCPHCGGAL